MEIIKYRRESIRELLEKYDETEVEVVFTTDSLHTAEKDLVARLAEVSMSLEYTMFKEEFWTNCRICRWFRVFKWRHHSDLRR